MVDSKPCTSCRATKPLSEFQRSKTKANGYAPVCKACFSEYRNALRAKKEGRPDLDTRPVVIPEMPLEVGLIIPDCHVPNHDERAWNLLLRVGLHLKPKHLVIMGDFADAETLSAHPATKPGEVSFEQEVNAVRECLTHLDGLGATNKVYVEGNHEFRLDRYLMERAPQMFYSIKWQDVLGLYERCWKWVPYRKSVKIGKLHLTHDVGSAGLNAHRVAAKAFGGNAAIGHTHRMAYEVTGRFDGPPYLAAMFGWLGDAEKAAGYLHEAKASDWVHGFGVFYLEPDTGVVHVQPVPIVNGRCVVQGKLFK